jgi:hypothetical protein
MDCVRPRKCCTLHGLCWSERALQRRGLCPSKCCRRHTLCLSEQVLKKSWQLDACAVSVSPLFFAFVFNVSRRLGTEETLKNLHNE